MRRYFAAAILCALTSATPARDANAGASVEVGHPGFYGRIELGGFPEPRLVFPEPVIIERVHVGAPPLYLHVPPGHAKDWAKHCQQYDACGHRVFFVQDAWYNDVYVPAYRERHGGGKSGGQAHKSQGKGNGKKH